MELQGVIQNPNPTLGSSQRNPVPIGKTIKTKIERGDRYSAPVIYDLEITLLEIIRGQEAWERVKVQEVFNELTKSGFEYMLVRLKVGFFRRGRGLGGDVYELREGQISTVSADGKTRYEILPVPLQPQPQLLDLSCEPGESHSGWIVLQVPKDEAKPLLLFNREYGENVYGTWGPIWFCLY